MNVNYIFSLIVVVALALVAYIGASIPGLQVVFGIIRPYAAIITFVVFFVLRVLGWARSPVPFRIPTTCGQQKSLPWIKQNKIDNPTTTWGVVVRMILEITVFRSLFRNTKMQLHEGKLTYKWEIWLWVVALAFHYSFLVVVVRHMRFFFEPVPSVIKIIEMLDGFFRIEFMSDVLKIGLPGIYISGLVLLGAVTFLFLRRIVIPPDSVYFPCCGLFSPVSDYGNCHYRHYDAVFHKS